MLKMKLYKCFISLWTQKYNFILKANSKEEVKNKLHNEGYSILSIKEIDEIKEDSKTKFYFKALNSWELKTWTVLAKDIFKVYFKLRDWLKYEILELYSEEDKNSSLANKREILKNLEEQYNILKKINNKKSKNKQIKKQVKINNNDIKDYSNFFMHKKLDKIHKNIEEVLDIVKNFLDKKIIKDLNFEEEESLDENYNNIVKVKNSTNIIKLQLIWEKILEKLWLILVKRIDNIEQNKLEVDEKYLQKLKENLDIINKLLKKLDSKIILREKSRDFKFIMKSFFEKLKKNTPKKLLDIRVTTSDIIDKTSNSYTKTLLLIEKYKQKKKENTKDLIRHFYILFFPEIILLKFSNNKKIKKIIELKDKILLRRDVIDQNIRILKVKIEKNNLIMLKLKKIFNFFIKIISNILDVITKYAFFLVFSFSIFFILFNLANYYNITKLNLNYKGLFYFIFFSIFIFFLRSIKKKISQGFRWIFLSFLNFIFFIILLVFWTINF